jgi:hypothetical protein
MACKYTMHNSQGGCRLQVTMSTTCEWLQNTVIAMRFSACSSASLTGCAAADYGCTCFDNLIGICHALSEHKLQRYTINRENTKQPCQTSLLTVRHHCTPLPYVQVTSRAARRHWPSSTEVRQLLLPPPPLLLQQQQHLQLHSYAV